MVDDANGYYRVSNSEGWDLVKTIIPTVTVPASFNNTPISALAPLVPSSQASGPFTNVLKTMMGPKLYDDIVVQQKVPNFWHAGI
jgi:hypothetical protein